MQEGKQAQKAAQAADLRFTLAAYQRLLSASKQPTHTRGLELWLNTARRFQGTAQSAAGCQGTECLGLQTHGGVCAEISGRGGSPCGVCHHLG